MIEIWNWLDNVFETVGMREKSTTGVPARTLASAANKWVVDMSKFKKNKPNDLHFILTSTLFRKFMPV